jgi:uncharacterized membrane protein
MRSLSHKFAWGGLVLAVFCLGIMAGFFGTYSGNVNLATRELDGPTYALVQSALNRNVRHPLFFTFFFGPPLLCLTALADAWRERPGWWWLVGFVGLAYLLGIVVFTREVNLPLNRLTESWTPATLPVDWASTRDAWNLANAWRAGWSALLFALGLAALSWRAAAAHGLKREQVAHPSAQGVPR